MALSLRNLFKKLQGGVDAIRKPLPPPVVLPKPQSTSARVQAAYQQSQPFIQQAQQQYQKAQPLNVIRNAPAELPRFNFAEKYKNPVSRFVATIPQEILNAPRDVFAGSLGLGANVADVAYGKKPVNPLRNIGTIGAGFVNAYAPGPAKQLATQAGKVGLRGLVKQGAIQGAKLGGLGGAAYGLQEGDNAKQQIGNALKQGAIGAVGGAVVGGALPAVANAFKKGKISAGMSVKNVGEIDPEIKIVSNNLLKHNPGITQKDAEAMAKDVIAGRKFNKSKTVDSPLRQEARKYKSAEEFVNSQPIKIYHSTNQANKDAILREGFKRGSELPEEAFRGGGHGQMQDSISFADNVKDASRFGISQKNTLIEAELKRGARVIDRTDIEFAEELNDEIPKLIKDGVDAVRIASGEGEIVVINPKAISNITDTFDFRGVEAKDLEKLFKSKSLTKSQLTDIYNQSKLDPTNTQAGGITVGSLVPKPLRKALGLEQPSKVEIPVSSKVPQSSQVPRTKSQQALGSIPENITDSKQVSSSTPFYNKDKINTSAKGKEAIIETIEQVKPRIEQTVGKTLTNKQVIEYAKNTSKVLNSTVTRKATQEKIAANLKLRQEIAKASQEGVVSQELIEAIIKDKAAASDIARQLQARTINANPAEKTLINEVLEAVLKGSDDTDAVLAAAKNVNFNDQEQVTAFYRQFVAPRAEDWLDKLRYSSMLSSPTTHIINTSSNLQGTGIVAPIEKIVAGGLDALRAGVTGGKRTQYAGEGIEYAKGYLANINNARTRVGDVMRGKLQSTNPDVRNIPLSTKPGAARTAEKILDIPTKALEAMDQFFTTLTEGGTKRALEYRASKGTKVGNLSKQAAEEAAYRLFRGELSTKTQGPVLDAFDSFTKIVFNLRSADNPIIRTMSKFTLPFVKTPMNLLKQGVEYSPLGLSTLPGAGNKTEQLAKALMGTAVGAATAILLGEDRLSWGEPRNQKEKNEFRAAGKIPYAVKIGDTWVSYSKLHPAISFNIAMVAGIQDALKEKKIDESNANAILEGLSQWGQFYVDQSYLRNIGDFLAATKGDVAGPARLVSNYTTQLIPFRALLGYINRIIDPVQRLPDADNVIQKQFQYMLTQIPGLSGQVPARTTEDGAVVLNQNRFLNAVSPARISTEQDNVKPFVSVSKDGKTKVKATASSGVYEKPDFAGKKAEVMGQIKSGEIDLKSGAEILRREKIKQMAYAINSKPELAPKLAPLYVAELKKELKSKATSVLKNTELTREQKKAEIQILKDEFKENVKGQIKYLKQSAAPTSNRTAVNILPSLGPITGINGSSLWKWGLDVDLAKGQPVPAAVGGQVIASARNGGFGNQVKIQGDDGRQYWYSHLDKRIAPGQRVNAGQIIGLGGNTGNVIPGRGNDGSHLDLTVVDENGRYIPARSVAQLLKTYS